MTPPTSLTRWKTSILWLALSFYLLGRLSQLWAGMLPSLLLVVLHVVPPAIFAALHGSIVYGRKGIALFIVCCLTVAGSFEVLSLRTGFPFGRYFFTDVMGPNMYGLPPLLVLAYLGIGYCSWVLALLILGYRDKPLIGFRAVSLPLLAAFLMLAWDLAMDPVWATVDRAWIWRDGGAFFGVPVSNFFGWYITAYLYYQAFALSGGAKPERPVPLSRFFWRAPILFYFLCAIGNLLLFSLPQASMTVKDTSGKEWLVSNIFAACAMISLLVMVPMALLAWLRLKEMEVASWP